MWKEKSSYLKLYCSRNNLGSPLKHWTISALRKQWSAHTLQSIWGVYCFFLSQIFSYFCFLLLARSPCQGKLPLLKYNITYPSDSKSSLRLKYRWLVFCLEPRMVFLSLQLVWILPIGWDGKYRITLIGLIDDVDKCIHFPEKECTLHLPLCSIVMEKLSEKECTLNYKYILPLFNTNVSISTRITGSSCKTFTVSVRNVRSVFPHSVLFGKTKIYQINLKYSW